jgi:hypothetical protein
VPYFLAGNSKSYRINFAAMNFRKIKDDYNENFAEILEKVQSGVSYFVEMVVDNMS